jgi:hypothetical protein
MGWSPICGGSIGSRDQSAAAAGLERERASEREQLTADCPRHAKPARQGRPQDTIPTCSPLPPPL